MDFYLNETYLIERTSDRVFHFTSVDAMEDIMKSNTIYFQSSLASNSDNKDRKRLFYFSLSRNKDTNFGFNSSVMSNPTRCFVRIEFDGDALNRKYRIKPIDYWGHKSYNTRDDDYGNSRYGKGWNKSRQQHVDFEYEDRIMTNDSEMYPAWKYITRVDVYVSSVDIPDRIMNLYSKKTFFYDDINEFNRQSDKNIKDIFEYLKDKDLVKYRNNNTSHAGAAAVEFGKLLYGPLNMPINKIANLFRKYNLEKFLDVKKITYWRNQGATNEMDICEIANTLSNRMHDISRYPNETTQRVNKMVTDTLRKMGIGSWYELKNKVLSKKSEEEDIDYANLDIPIRCLKVGSKYVLEPDKVSVWKYFPYTDRKTLIDNLYTDITNDYGGSGERHSSKDDEHFYKYLQHKLKNDFTVADFVKLIKKFNIVGMYVSEPSEIEWVTMSVSDLWFKYDHKIVDFEGEDIKFSDRLRKLLSIAKKQQESKNESIVRGIFIEAVERILLNEADSRLKVVDRILNERFSKLLNLDGTVSSTEYYVNGNPNTTWRQYLLFHLRHEFGLMTNADVKYLPVVARLAYSDEVQFDITNDNGEEINLLKRIVAKIKKDDDLFQQVKADSNITFRQLVEKFKEEFEKEDAADTEEANKVVRSSEYEIKEVPDFETAKYYGDRSCSSSKLCYTQNESIWDSWTKNGMNTVYVCLKKGWEDIPETPTEGNPYDLYGTSMIFAFIAPNGNLINSNCRWNHRNVEPYNGGVDNAFTKTTLAQTVGVPFDDVFKPHDIDLEALKLREMIEKGGETELRNYVTGDFVIPDGVKVIGDMAFSGCIGLTSVTIPNSVTLIRRSAFSFCTGLTSVTIPSSVTWIGDNPFLSCGNLTSISIDEGNTKYDSRDNCNAIIKTDTNTLISGCNNTVIPNSVTVIGKRAFSNTRLVSLNIPDSIITIEYNAFADCRGLASLTIPKSVHSIDGNPFVGCYNLASIVVEAENKIYDSRNNCNAIIATESNILIAGCKNTIIPNSVKKIGNYAFEACEGLTSITIPDSVTSIGEDTFGCCRHLVSVNIPNSVENIGDGAFYGCRELTSITIPNSVRVIGEDVFRGCKSLTDVNIPNSVQVIGSGAFARCKSLTSVTIPDSVTSVDEQVFHSCDNLKIIHVHNKNQYDFFVNEYPNIKIHLIGANESRKRHKKLFENKSGTKTLYHSTSFDGIDSMVWDDMIMSARKGGQHGETFGVNWFATSREQTNGKPVIIAIDVPEELLCNSTRKGCFCYMNDHHLVANDDEVDLKQYNPRIVKFGAITEKVLERLIDKYGDDTGEIMFAINRINDRYIDIFGDVATLCDDSEDTVFDYLLKSLI